MRFSPLSETREIPSHFHRRVVYCSLYYLAAALRRSSFPYYEHHRILSVKKEAFWWARAAVRKYLYRPVDQLIWRKIQQQHKNRFYLIPLQIRDDAQIQHHSDFEDIEEFIETGIASFSQNAPHDTALVIKHHPMDRGHSQYGAWIRKISQQYKVQDRVFYVHDLANPVLLRQTLGLLTINSTMGLSGILHGKKVKTFGSAFYDMEGLTFQGQLEDFWKSNFKPLRRNFIQFQRSVLVQSQLVGSFYIDCESFTLPKRFFDALAGARIAPWPAGESKESLS